MNKSKIIVGWSLLALGVAIIFYSLFSSYNIFTGKTAVPGVFSITDECTISGETNTQKGTGGLGKLGLGDIDIQKIVGNQLKGMLPDNAIPKALNLAVWAVLAWILIMAGGQIAGIGIKLLKNN